MGQVGGLLRDRDFRQLFLADTISQFGTQITMIAMPLVAVLALHATAFEVGLLAACETAAFLIVGLPAGAWVDRMRRRVVLLQKLADELIHPCFGIHGSAQLILVLEGCWSGNGFNGPRS